MKRFSAVLMALALAVPAAATPPRKKAAPPKSAPAATRGKAAKPAPTPESLVRMGKRPAFFDPADLSKPPVITAPSAVLMDADTGQILWEQNGSERHFPASTTKILTGLLFIEHSKPDDIITCMDPKITQIEESSLHIKPWEKFTAQDLLYGFMLRSANDGAVVIAEHVAGSVPKFADMMNARAREIGATDSHFVTPNGLHDPDHYTTARDLALIARAAMQNPRFADAVSIPRRKIERSKEKADTLITAKSKKQFYDKFPGADGVKTGYTRNARHCFVGSATRGGRRLLVVVLSAVNSAISDTTPILSWGFQRFPTEIVASEDKPAGVVPVKGGVAATVPVVAGGTLHASVDSLSVSGVSAVQTEIQPDQTIEAPIQRGQVVGHLIARVGKLEVGSVPLLASEDVARSPVKTAAVGFTHWILPLLGALGVVLVAWRYGTASAKSARRRRNRLAASRRGVDRVG